MINNSSIHNLFIAKETSVERKERFKTENFKSRTKTWTTKWRANVDSKDIVETLPKPRQRTKTKLT